MGPVTIAVDSFGPVTDNAQSVYELSQIESRPDIKAEIQRDFGFAADFETAKYQLEKGDGAGNTFKATAKPVLIGTAVVGATTMVFGIILMLDKVFGGVIEKLSLVHPEPVLGLLMGGAVVYWFTGASTQAVVTGRLPRRGLHQGEYAARRRIRLDRRLERGRAHLHAVRAARHGEHLLRDLLLRVGAAVLQSLFLHRLPRGLAFFGLFQAVFMANAGGAWDNAKKIVEVELKQKNTPLHAATVVGDTVAIRSRTRRRSRLTP